MEGFVLSRVDGRTTAAEIALLTGLGDGVLPVLQRLAELGAVTGVAGASPKPPAATSAAPTAPPPRATGSVAPTGRPASSGSAPPDAKLGPSWTGPLVADGGYTQQELDQPADLEPDKKRRVLSVFHALARLDHYQLLGVDRAADKKAIKAAYFKLAAEFHPDKHFRKELGAFKPKMEAIFKRLTQAEETLSRKETRAEYDATLEVRAQSLVELELFSREDFDAGVARASAPPARPAAPAPPPRSPTPSPASASLRAASVAAPPPPRRSSEVAIPVVGASQPPELGPATVRGEARRSALVSKLSSGRFTPRAPVQPGEAPGDPGDPRQSVDSLRRMAAERQASAHREQVERYLEVAEAAAARDDAVGAANSYRFAAALDPTPELVEQAREWGAKAAVLLADDYLAQGEAAAREESWVDAARALRRAVAGKPDDPRVLAMAANALLQAKGDLHEAADLARRATERDPRDLSAALVLVEIYVAAKLKLSAQRALAAAAAIAPDDAKVRALQRQVG